ncbi:MAG: hypothetical protein ACKE9I_08060 [Methylophagaceae bacterium]
MHIILSVLAVVVTVLILLNRLSDNGIDVGWLNPFAWKRRREWSKKYHADPVYSISRPMEVTALIIVALVKSEGDISAEQKQTIIQMFERVFQLDNDAALGLLSSSNFLLKDDLMAVKNIDKVLAPSIDNFSQQQARSAMDLFREVVVLEGVENRFQKEVISSFENAMASKFGGGEGWDNG